MRMGLRLNRERGVAAAAAVLLTVAGCTAQPTVPDTATTVPSTDTSLMTVASSMPTTPPSRVTTTTGPCGESDVGLNPGGGPPIGPVIVCIDILVSSDRPVDAGLVDPDHSAADAEEALLALGAMTDFTTPEGLMNLVPAGYDIGMDFQRSDGVLSVSLPVRFRNIPALGTSANNDAFLLQMFGTAFTDPSIDEAHFSLEGDSVAFCAMLERDSDCAAMTRGEFFGS